MKIPVQSINKIDALLAEVGTDYFLYHYPFSMFDSKAQLKSAWKYMNGHKQWRAVKRIGVSNFIWYKHGTFYSMLVPFVQ